MAAGDITIFNTFRKNQNNGVAPIDFDTDTIKCMLVTATYTPNYDTHDYINDISANEVAAGASYSAGGVALANKSLVQSGNNAIFDADDISIAQDGTGFTNARYVIFYKDTGTPATSPVIALGDLGADKSIQGGALNLNWNASGILSF